METIINSGRTTYIA